MPISFDGYRKVELELICLNGAYFNEKTLNIMKEKYFKLKSDYGEFITIRDSVEAPDDIYYKEVSVVGIPVEDVEWWLIILKNREIEVDIIHPDWERGEILPEEWEEYKKELLTS